MSSPALTAGRSTPLRIVFAGIGSRGDVQPVVALALHAKARGHHVVVAASSNFGDWVRSLGLEFAACGVDMQKFLADDPHMMTGGTLGMLRALRVAATEHSRLQLRDMLEACRGADALVWAGVAITAPTAAEAAGIPHVNVLYSPCWIASAHYPPPVLHWYGLPGWANRCLWKVNDWLGARLFGRVMNPLRTSLGLPACNVQRQFFKDGTHFIASDDVMLPPKPDWGDEHYPRANFIFFDDTRALDPELDAWLRDGPPPVFAGFGSMSGPGPQRATRALVDALAGSGRRCLVGAGWARLDPAHLPAGWRIVADVPHAQLFPRVAVVIHHGGSGTTAAVLRSGTPQVVLPLLLDQYHHAHMLHRSGLGPRPVAMEDVTAASLSQAIDEALRVPQAAREQVAQRLRHSDAAGTILAHVESMAAHDGAHPAAERATLAL
jgi:vancomycin aglycone glucosyltransferase